MKLFTLKAVNTRINSARFRSAAIYFSLAALICAGATEVKAQAVTGIITDYNGWWSSTTTVNNPTKPTNSHNVLAFTYNGVQYSTGVNDASLAAHGEVFIPSDFWSLPFSGMTGTITSNTKVGVGELQDGVHGGAGIVPDGPLSTYLTDGIKGLDIGTAIANLPQGNLVFSVSNIQASNIGDGIPDILVTQVADPSGSTDKYSFTDANGVVIGHQKNITFTNITPVGKWTADFYEASSNPRVLTTGFTNTDRDMRLWAADLSDLGVTVDNYTDIRKFVVELSGNSDVAFAAYNNRSFNLGIVLPVKLTDFTAIPVNDQTQINWKTVTESNSSKFVVERSDNNQTYASIASVAAAGSSNTAKSYSFVDEHPKSGVNYYRIKMIDIDGTSTYTNVISLKYNRHSGTISLYPNPAVNEVFVSHPAASGKEVIKIYNAAGNTVAQLNVSRGSNQTRIDVHAFARGVYYVMLQNETSKTTQNLVIR